MSFNNSDCIFNPKLTNYSYWCFYGYTSTEYYYSDWFERLYLWSMLYMMAGATVLGFFGNMTVIIVVSRDKLSSVSILLITLAVSDTLHLFAMSTYYLPRQIYSYYEGALEHVVDFVMRNDGFVDGFYWFSKMMSVYTIVMITLERFIVVWKPLQAHEICTKRKTMIAVFSQFVIIFLYIIPFVLRKIPRWDCDPCRGYYRSHWEYSETYDIKIVKYFYDTGYMFPLILQYVFPMSLIMVLNSLILSGVNSAKKQRLSMGSSAKKAKTDDATKMIMVVVTLFVVLESPQFLMYDASNLGLWVDIGYLSAALNSSCNFIVYTLFGKRFRTTFLSLFCCCFMMRKKGLKRENTTTVDSADL